MRSPRIWVLLGHRTGDNNQLLALAEALKLPFETRTLKFNLLRALHPWLGSSLASLRRDSRRGLEAPWPDLVVGIGWRSVPVARWVRKQSGGRTRLVRLGHPRADARLFDLIITTPQYPVGEHGHILTLPLGMSRYSSTPAPTEDERSFLDALPRPHRLLAVGGPAKYWQLTVDRVCSAAMRLAIPGGTLLAVTSPRTPPDITRALGTIDRDNVQLVSGRIPRFPVLLADADEIYVTGDSVAMLSEAVLTGKPVGIVPIDFSAEGQRRLERRPESTRDLRRFWASLRERGLAGTLDRPVAGHVADPAATAADAVKALLGDLVE
jgi:mitochondrial fission protein ELM1